MIFFSLRHLCSLLLRLCGESKAPERFNGKLTLDLKFHEQSLMREGLADAGLLYGLCHDRSGAAAGADRADRTRRFRTAEPEDAVVVYFSGHGLAVSNSFYLIPTDLGYTGAHDRESLSAGLQTILSHSIPDRELEESFEQIDAGQLLLVIDACNSGQALEAEEKRRGPINSKGLGAARLRKRALDSDGGGEPAGRRRAAQTRSRLSDLRARRRGFARRACRHRAARWLRLSARMARYATGRVPQMQEEGERERRLLEQEEEPQKGRTKAPSTRRGEQQRPRVFYRREPEAQPLLVARTK